MHGDIKSQGYWEKVISIPENYEVELLEDPGVDKLSDVEESLIGEIFKNFGSKSRWELCDFTHTLDEWQNPNGSSIKIDYRDILRSSKLTESEIESILEEIENLALTEMYLEH